MVVLRVVERNRAVAAIVVFHADRDLNVRALQLDALFFHAVRFGTVVLDRNHDFAGFHEAGDIRLLRAVGVVVGNQTQVTFLLANHVRVGHEVGAVRKGRDGLVHLGDRAKVTTEGRAQGIEVRRELRSRKLTLPLRSTLHRHRRGATDRRGLDGLNRRRRNDGATGVRGRLGHRAQNRVEAETFGSAREANAFGFDPVRDVLGRAGVRIHDRKEPLCLVARNLGGASAGDGAPVGIDEAFQLIGGRAVGYGGEAFGEAIGGGTGLGGKINRHFRLSLSVGLPTG